MPKKVLIITYYWPPGSGPGVQRFLKFSKYLPQFGWLPSVLTVKNGSYPNTDETLLKDIPTSVEVHRTKALEPFTVYNALRGKKGKAVEVGMGNIRNKKSRFQNFANYIRSNYFIPDARVGWNRYAINRARKLLQTENFDAIITTGPPHSTHLIGLALKKEFDIPWIADLRDPWTTIYYMRYLKRTKGSHKKDKAFENEVAQQANALTVVSEGLRREFAERNSTIEVIHNGFDRDDMPDNEKGQTKQFSIAYIGNFKPNQNIESCWNAIRELRESNPEFDKLVRLDFTGNVAPNIMESIKSNGLSEVTHIHPFVPHAEATERMINSNLLLFPIPIADNSKAIITGKIFEYLASGTPIWGVGPEDGDGADILKKMDRNPMCDYSDKATLQKQLHDHFNNWMDNMNTTPTETTEGIERFSRRSLSQKLANLLSSIS